MSCRRISLIKARVLVVVQPWTLSHGESCGSLTSQGLSMLRRLEAPTGPRSSRGSQHGTSDRRSNGSISGRDRAASGDSYRPSPSEPRGERVASGSKATDKRQLGGNQTPSSTNEMETAVPRALPPSDYHQKRSHFYRKEQQRKW